MEWKFVGACFFVIWMGKTNSLESRSNLCRPRRSYTLDCAHQMGISQGGCSAVIERNNTACWDMSFPSWNSPPLNGRHFKLKTYCYNNGAYQRTGLNATINSGSWTEAAFRFKIEGKNYVSCVQFIHNASINDNFMLFYDCIWHENDLYGEQMKVDYFLKDQNRDTMEFGSFHFILPQCHFNEIGDHVLDISRHQTFIYVDEKASSFSTIHIQKMPVDYQVSSYIIKKCHTCQSNLNKTLECSKAYCTTEEKIKTDINEEEIVLKVPNSGNETCFYVTVEAVCHNCSTSNWCVARSVLLIPSKTGLTALPFIVVPLCFLIVLALSYIYCTTKHRTVDGNSYRRPTVLLVYNPVHDIHVQIIMGVVKLMTHCCGIDVLFADTDIAKSKEKNPLVWYNRAVSEVDYIAVVSALSSLNKSCSTYNNIFQIGMTVVEETIKRSSSAVKFFNISFPYNLKNDVPIKTKCHENFNLMKQFDDMVIYVHKSVSSVRGQPLKLKVPKRVNRWTGYKSLPDYLELCKNIETMEKLVAQEEGVSLSTTEDNFVMSAFLERTVPVHNIAEYINNTTERSVSAPAHNIAEHISNITDVPVKESRSDLDQEYQSLQELLQRNEHSTHSSRETVDEDSKHLINTHAFSRDAFVTSVDKFLDLDGLL
ncbi:uncharacterized protein LOC126457600 [Schistocerca serialis cubense]|uniref:uncharacterized protein LOC126457600 n=1 Tax=Schistocerca serialis cubense TaxID=2023355 RepID=UPI00214EE7C8|nr:uncharacterized protein LOC126457600 [Schistocerca serialis cubense]XP_049950003.1 uncharacterized protein LOC126457600 [Schistocerca serialis cubense]XP_049950004.1 uncharacterized protein LOC126457600 [Schistocerca serialis cubense]